MIIISGTCQEPMLGGQCYSDLLRFFYDHESGECRAFTYGGCSGNSNNFETQEECYEFCSPTQEHVIRKPGKETE